MRKRRNVGLVKTLKDYAVPIIGGILFILFIINIFSGNDNPENNVNENRIGLELSLTGDSSEAYIIYSGGKERKIKDNKASLYKGERIRIKEGTISFSLPGVGDMNLQKFGELEYKEDGTFFLYSSDLWINTISNFNLNTRYANINISENSSISVNQNEVATTIYLMKGTAEVNTLGGKHTILKKGQKITIGVKDANNTDIDISLLKKDIDDYFKASDWFLKNKGDFYLLSEDIITSSGSLKTSSGTTISNGLIFLENIGDESSVLTPTIDIIGGYEENNIGLITVNNTETSISRINKRFELKGFQLKSSINDLVFKIYDENKNLLGKEIYTIYYSGGAKVDTNANTTDNSNEQQNLIADASNFVFTSPNTSGKYITSENFVTIRGKSPANTAKTIKVNGYQLKSYNGTTWRYHADVNTNNLKLGTNIYDIKYYDKDGNIIFKTYYTIIKKKASATPVEKTTTTYSEEVSVR